MRGALPALLLLATAPVCAAPEALPGNAIEKTGSVDEIVVVATKRETGVRNIAADVTVLDAAYLRSTLSTSLADTFRFVPGVTHESSGSRFGAEGVTIRGIGGNRVALELDGVPLSDQFDIGNFSSATRDFADAGMLGRIEVLRGPASALYGSSAIGGVVAMRTLEPRDFASRESTSGRVGALYRGLDASSNLQAGIALHGQTVSLIAAGSYRDGSEADSAALATSVDRQAYTRDAALLKLVGNTGTGGEWRITALKQAYDVRSDIQSVLGSGRFRSTTRLEGDDRHGMDTLSAEYRFAARSIDEGVVRVFGATTDIRQRTLDERAAGRAPASIQRDFFFDQHTRGAEVNLWHDRELGGWSHRFGLGLEYTDTRTEESRDGLSTSLVDGTTTRDILGESFPLRDFPITDTRQAGAFVSDQLDRDRLSLMVALRYDDNRLTPRSDAIYAADNPSTPVVALSESDVSPKVGIIYRLGDNVDIYLQYAEGFRAPPFEDANIGLDIPLFNIRAIPNPDLKSESSDGWELGLRWRSERTRLNAGIFRTEYSDFIETKVRIGIDPQSGRLLFQSINIGDAWIRGAEARWSHDLSGPLDNLTLHASAYWAQGENRDNGLPLNSVGPAEAVFGVTWRSPDEGSELRALLTATDDWSRRDESGGELFKPAGHAVLDLFYSRIVGERLTIRAGVGNVTDRTYWRWSEVRGLSPEDALIGTLAEAGRHYSFGLQWGW